MIYYFRICFFRFVNIVTKKDKNFIKEKIGKVRHEFLNGYKLKDCSLNTFIDDDDMNLNLDKLSKELNVSNQEFELNQYSDLIEKTKNLSIDEINFAGEMFTSLNVCPTKFARIYTKIIMNGTASKIIKLSNNLVKKSPSDFKPKATKIFSKILSVFNIQYINSVEEIKNKTKETVFIKNTSNVKGDGNTEMKLDQG